MSDNIVQRVFANIIILRFIYYYTNYLKLLFHSLINYYELFIKGIILIIHYKYYINY